MNLTNSKEIKFKNGLAIPSASICEITFDGMSTYCSVAVHSAGNLKFRIRCSSLPRYFSKFKEPSVRTMEKWNDDGIARSMLGHKVEPDGFDPQGSPSWMLVVGII